MLDLAVIVLADLRSISVTFNPHVPGLQGQRQLPTGAEKQLKNSRDQCEKNECFE